MPAPFHRVCAPLTTNERRAQRSATTARLLAVAARTNFAIRETYDGPHASYIMRPFEFPNPSRFSDGTFGVHYSANALDVAVSEHAFHLARALRDTRAEPMELRRAHINLRFAQPFRPIDDGRPELLDPNDYSRSQVYGAELYRSNAPGLKYPSVRYSGHGFCAGLFRPSLATEVHLVTDSLPLIWDGHHLLTD
jgi:hypothetical protein